MLEEYIYKIFIFVLGMVIGSFISLITYRLPNDMDIIYKRSACPKCKKNLGVLELIPIFSYLLQKGKCKNCNLRINPRYILIEITTSFSFLIAAMLYEDTLLLTIMLFIIANIIIMIVTDLEYYMVPDSIQLTLLLSTVTYSYFYGNLLNGFFIAILISSFLYILGKIIEKFLKKPSLGFGDVKFLFAIGFVLELHHLPSFFFLSGILGMVFGLLWKTFFQKDYFPFIPALAISFLLCLNEVNILNIIPRYIYVASSL